MKAFLLATVLLMALAPPANAQLVGTDTAPGASCAGFPAGATRITADPDQNGAEITLVCDGSTWNSQGVKIGYDAAACSSARDGTIRFTSSSDTWEFCNGSAWVPFERRGNGYFVQTATRWNGNLGGISGANALCLTELQTTYNWLGKSDAGTLTASRVKAFLCDGTTCNNLNPNTAYIMAKANDTTKGGGGFRTDASGQGPGTSVWWDDDSFLSDFDAWTNRGTGTAELWGTSPQGANHCTNWTVGTSGVSGRVGNGGNNNASRWSSASATCNGSKYLYCFVNP